MGLMAQFFNKRFGMGIIPILYGRADYGLYQPFYLLASNVPAPLSLKAGRTMTGWDVLRSCNRRSPLAK